MAGYVDALDDTFVEYSVLDDDAGRLHHRVNVVVGQVLARVGVEVKFEVEVGDQIGMLLRVGRRRRSSGGRRRTWLIAVRVCR